MVFTINSFLQHTLKKLFILSFLFSGFNTATADSYPGLPTRSQNPLLQSYFIPATPITSSQQSWVYSHALYFTNTYQTDKYATEELLIDVENTRYDFQLTYSHELWHFNFNSSLVTNKTGFLDQTIERWHDFFGLPQGGRDQAENNKINLLYHKDGLDIINSSQPDEGLADIQLAVGYQINSNSQFWLAIELPSSSSEFISNDATDIAAWYSTHSLSSQKLSTYGTLGIVFSADNGILKNQLNDNFLFGQLGLNYKITPSYHLILQADFHSEIVKQSQLDAFESSLQAQFGLRFPSLFENHQLELFFSEDIFPGHAPDITFGLRVSAALN
ncbi:MAG: DUF3187 family protein [Gammaproteobacteria bacterium]|jgi:hypothetical protein|nr:DUF3187 family protein [Gammaproteobacteria bacterium]MBT3723292.1 DUF3187 family protein [Gammaproteobacteria bacterium]MBT4075663.1 DUF3187 family protein [Gammaproteobacteria bacterium]MBT4194565.1 DUF3187 family protein [Gammaproteobacteria bacterium]MBT4449802.1 DUF3187 family protein [Gammaproteobacteria bacterium]